MHLLLWLLLLFHINGGGCWRSATAAILGVRVVDNSSRCVLTFVRSSLCRRRRSRSGGLSSITTTVLNCLAVVVVVVVVVVVNIIVITLIIIIIVVVIVVVAICFLVFKCCLFQDCYVFVSGNIVYLSLKVCYNNYLVFTIDILIYCNYYYEIMRPQCEFCSFSHMCLCLSASHSVPCFHVIQFELNRSTSPPGGNQVDG